MRSQMAYRVVNSQLNLPKESTGERHKAQWAETIRSNPNELRFAARDADRIADKVLEHDRPQLRLPSEPQQPAVAAPATPERMQGSAASAPAAAAGNGRHEPLASFEVRHAPFANGPPHKAPADSPERR